MVMRVKQERIVLQMDGSTLKGYEQSGTPEAWRELVAKPCTGNSRLVLGVCAAFAAPLLTLLDQQGFTIHVRGASSIGKSSMQLVGKSVIGSPQSIYTWRATSSALENVAALHNDNLLCLDEIGESEPKDIGVIAYMLNNGQGKLRQTRNITLREVLRWRLIVLSNGELSLADVMTQNKQRMQAGQAVRVIDIPADADRGLGLFERLPDGVSSGREFADRLKEVTHQQHGTAFRAYLKQLVQDRPTHLQTIKNYREQWKERYLPASVDSQVGRVADSFATLAAAGELATDFGLTGWPVGAAGEGIALCFHAWIEARGGTGNQEEADILAYVRNHFEANGSAQYAYIDERYKDDKVMYRMGYRDDKGDFYVLPHRFASELCQKAGFDQKQVIAVLLKHKHLIPSSNGRATMQKRIYPSDADNVDAKKKNARVYHIDSSIVGGVD